MMDKVSVFLADWQVLFREGIHFTLSGEEDINVIGETTDNKEALDFIEKNIPAVAVLNANHSDFTGISLTGRLCRNVPSVSVILIMDTEDDDIRFAALKCGAKACITKNIDPEEIVSLIKRIASGERPIVESFLKPGIAARVMEEFKNFSQINRAVEDMLASLSDNETRILSSLAGGDSIEQVSLSMGVSEHSIRHHLETIVTKLVNNDHNRDIIEAAQKNLPLVMPRTGSGKKETAYVSREEFEAFKENIRERFKAMINELG
jgi:DNA-binding NarL/FixJ family response regulator